MLTFWGKPRNQHLYDHAHEAPIMWLPLVVLAVLSIIGGSYLPVKDFLKAAIKESNTYCRTIDKQFTGFDGAWPADEPKKEVAAVEGVEHATVTASELSKRASEALEKGEEHMHAGLAGGFAWLIGIGAGFIIYMNGYSIASALMKITPLRWIHTWLYRRMYFDELYFSVFVAIVMIVSWFSARFDKYVVDGFVNAVGRFVKGASDLSGLTDRYVVDGAVNGVATLSQDLGAAVRAPQTGRIRMYVTMLMAAVSLGIAIAIIVVLSR